MKSWLRWILIVAGTVLVTLVLLRQHYVLSSVNLDKAIKTDSPWNTESPSHHLHSDTAPSGV